MKRFLTPLFLVAVVSALLAGCKGCGGDPGGTDSNRVAKGKVKYGGVFRMNEVEDFRSLYPLNVIDQPSMHIAQQIYEGLVKLDQKTLIATPCLASSWEVLDSATRFVFHLRGNVKFHDNPCFADGKGKTMTAKDVKYCFDRLCTYDEKGTNQQFLLTFKDRVAGANEHYEASRTKKQTAGGVSGVKVVNDTTLEIQLLNPFAAFLSVLSMPGCWIYPEEAHKAYGEDMRIKCVGTGPFILKNAKEGEVVILEYNPVYWDFDSEGNRLPYLDGVRCEFIKDRHSELLAFKSGKLEMMFRLPVEMVSEIMGDTLEAKAGATNWDLQSVTGMSLTFYGFQHLNKPFDNPKLRQAMNYAIDRNKIAVNVLQGDAMSADYGVVPPSIAGYDYKSIKGYTYDVEMAKKLLAEAGFAGGKGLPPISLSINNGGNDRNLKVAEAVKNMLKENLGVEVTIDPLPLSQQLQALQTGKSNYFKVSWSADYPDPETFLTLFYGKHVPATMDEPSYTNTTRYQSARFDSLFEASLREANPARRLELYRMADQAMMDDAAIMPIYYEINDRLVQKYVRGLDINPMEYRDLSRVWLDIEDKTKTPAEAEKK
ncbi:MAG: peptide/nickel transport system substrate-binding protein [Bacteroidetes bacterium]|nr:MAG: peptide/nickel transport system substrate-binding protein [Bacteroidota bacterium]